MRHGALLLALAVAATAPSLAHAKKLHHHRVAPPPAEATAAPGPNPFIADGLHQFFVPLEVTLRALTTPQPAPAPVVHHHRVHHPA